MIRVLHIIIGLGAGGAERMLTRIVTGSTGADVEQIVVSLMDEGEYGTRLHEAGAEVHCLGMQRGLPSPGVFLRLTRILRQRRPDVVMTWLYHADLMGTVCAVLAGLSPRRVVWNLRCSDIDFALYAHSARLVVRMLSRLASLPGTVAVNSEAGKAHHIALGYRPREWAYLPNGLDLAVWRPDPADRARVRRELEVVEDEVLVGMVARVDPLKDHATFLAAAEQLAFTRRNVRFVLVGKGTRDLSLPAALQGRLVALDFQQDIPRLMRAIDIHVLSSAFGEGFPNVVCEAMATEVPCVVTDVGDAAMLVDGNGLAVPPRDPAALAGAIDTLLQETPEQRRERGRAAQDKVARNFDINAVCDAYYAVWRNIAKPTSSTV